VGRGDPRTTKLRTLATQFYTWVANDSQSGSPRNLEPKYLKLALMGARPADCVRACVQKGAKYSLVVGDKVYTLSTSDKAALDKLNKLAWEEAEVTGTANGDTISVKSVTAAK